MGRNVRHGHGPSQLINLRSIPFAMSDDEDVEQFETADSGASTTIPMQAGNVLKGGFMVIKGRPTKVIDVTTSKTGKHGHAKCHFTATDIFTGKKMEELVPSSHNLEVPIVSREDYTLVDLNDEGFVSSALTSKTYVAIFPAYPSSFAFHSLDLWMIQEMYVRTLSFPVAMMTPMPSLGKFKRIGMTAKSSFSLF